MNLNAKQVHCFLNLFNSIAFLIASENELKLPFPTSKLFGSSFVSSQTNTVFCTASVLNLSIFLKN